MQHFDDDDHVTDVIMTSSLRHRHVRGFILTRGVQDDGESMYGFTHTTYSVYWAAWYKYGAVFFKQYVETN